MVCAPSLVSVPQSTGLLVLAQFFVPQTYQNWIRWRQSWKEEGGERRKWMARVSNLANSWTRWNSHFLCLEFLVRSQFKKKYIYISIIWYPMKICIYLLSFISPITCIYIIQTYFIQQKSENKFSKKFSFFLLKTRLKNLPQIIASLLVLYCCI